MVAGLASDIERQDSEFRITLAGGEVIRADRVDVATGGAGNQRFGSDSGPTAFTTLHGNEEAIAEVHQPGWEVACLGASADVLDVMQFMHAALPVRKPRLRILGDAAESGLAGDPMLRAWMREGRIEVMPGVVTWVYAEEAGKVRVRLQQTDGTISEVVVPLVVNTAGPGDQLALDFVTSGMVSRGWLDLDEDKRGVAVGSGFAGRVDGLRYASSAVRRLDGSDWDACAVDPDGLVRLMRAKL